MGLVISRGLCYFSPDGWPYAASFQARNVVEGQPSVTELFAE
jgi:hypothetical protein